MWRDEKTEYLRKNRDYSRLLDGDDAEAQTPRSLNGGKSNGRDFDNDEDDVSRERQEYLDRRRRLKELERQKLTKGKNGIYVNGSKDKGEAKAGDQKRGDGGKGNRDGGLATSKEKKKLPYDRSFGSFFGPSEPVVAKRIIEEARARDEAEIVAAREAKVTREVERKKSTGTLSAGKPSQDGWPSQKPVKSVDKVTEKARKLKEARDYSFLFDDSPLPDPKASEKKVASTLKLGSGGRNDSGKSTTVRLNNTTLKKAPLVLPKSGLGSRGSDKNAGARPLQTQSKYSQPSRPSPSQATRDLYASDRPSSKNRPMLSSSAKPSKVLSAGPGRPDPRKETDLAKEAVMKKLVSGSTLSNGTKRSAVDKRPLEKRLLPSQTMDRRPSQNMDRRPTQATDRRPSQTMDRRPTQATDRRPSQGTDRRPSQVLEKRPAQSADKRPAQPSDKRPAQPLDKRPAQPTDRRPLSSQTSERRPIVAQGLKKGTVANGTYRSAGGGAEPRRQVAGSQIGRQSLQPKSLPKGSRPAPSGNKARYSDDSHRDDIRRKRARSLSEESDHLIQRKRRRSVSEESDDCPRRRRVRSPSEEDDSFIDDGGDTANVSSLIHKLMGYNPNKYRGNDDIDDRSMEVGFRTIQAEERRSAREARLEDERELALIEAEEKEERLRKAKKKQKLKDR